MTSVTSRIHARSVGSTNLSDLLAPVQLIFMDVDGVLTDGRFYFRTDPSAPVQIIETKSFDSQDGLALQWLRQFNIPTGLISGRDSPATAERARTAGFRFVYQGHLEKTAILQSIASHSWRRSKFDVVPWRRFHRHRHHAPCQGKNRCSKRTPRSEKGIPLRYESLRRCGQFTRSLNWC